MQARLLCVGDIHLGRRPSRLPSALEAKHGIDPSGLDPRAAWRATVERAISEEVDALLLAGDVVDSKNHFMEAYGALAEGVGRLVTHGIEVVCVAGNHDVDALPRLADELPSVHLLGRRGTWQSHVVRRAGQPLLRVVGWSFPKRHVESSPLDAMDDAMRAGRFGDDAPDDLPTVGLLHCDLDAHSSQFAPVSSSALTQLEMGVSAWFLGHVHAPSIQAGRQPLGYLGSLVGLDPGEPGQHGPWLASAQAGQWNLEQIPLSPVRWEAFDVNIEHCVDMESILGAIGKGARDLEAQLAATLEGTRVVGLRPRLVGTCGVPLGVIREALVQGLQLEINPTGVVYFVEKMLDATRPRVDLQALATKNDPVGLVAQRLLALEADAAESADLIRGARPSLEAVARHPNFGHLGSDSPSDEQVRELLLRQGRRALEELLDQKRIVVATPSSEENLA